MPKRLVKHISWCFCRGHGVLTLATVSSPWPLSLGFRPGSLHPGCHWGQRLSCHAFLTRCLVASWLLTETPETMSQNEPLLLSVEAVRYPVPWAMLKNPICLQTWLVKFVFFTKNQQTNNLSPYAPIIDTIWYLTEPQYFFLCVIWRSAAYLKSPLFPSWPVCGLMEDSSWRFSTCLLLSCDCNHNPETGEWSAKCGLILCKSFL